MGRNTTNFRQTPKEFRSARQTEVYEHIKKNIPYRIFAFTSMHISGVFTKVHRNIKAFSSKLPKDAKRIK